jgi:hypothetical protein
MLSARGISPIIPGRGRRKNAFPLDRETYKKRNVIPQLQNRGEDRFEKNCGVGGSAISIHL